MGFTWHNLNGMAYLTSDLLSATGLIKHGFSTRHGTLYGEVTDEFNLGYKKGDSIAIQQMRQVFLVSLGISLDNLVAGQQTHGAKVALVTEADAGRGAFSWEDGLPATDALVTGANVALSVYTADCVPLLFFDPVNGAIGAAHAGWRGSVRGIAVGTLQSLQHNFNSRPEDVLVAIGPSIGPCCYEVDDNVLLPLKNNISWWADVISPSRPGHVMLSLWELNQRLLLGAGVRTDHIDVARICTYCNRQDFFSYRGEQGRAGSLMATISL